MKLWASPLGLFELNITQAGISHLALGQNAAGLEPVADDLAASLTEHVHGRPASLRLDLQSITSPIAQLTLAKLLEIPYGEVRSYSWVAKEIGHAAAVRPVANAIATNPIPVLIPCHRVIRSDGRTGDYVMGPDLKREVLAFEGLDLNRIDDLAYRGVRYLGEKETNTYHLPSCRLAPEEGSPTCQELHHIEQALGGHLDPCRRCRPI